MYAFAFHLNIVLATLVLCSADTCVQIFVAGDSAGGNLALSLLSHLVHPQPEVAEKVRLNLSEPLGGAVLISPWVNFDPEQDSVKRNATSDMVTASAAIRWSESYLGEYSHRT